MNKENNTQLFLNVNIQEDLHQSSKQVEFKKGSSPFLPEDLLEKFYIVIEGKVRTYQFNFENSKEQSIFIYKRGDMFDVISLLDNKVHEIYYEVLQDCILLEIPMDKIRYLLENNLEFNKLLFPYIASQMRYTEELSSTLSLYDTKERLMNLLVQNLNPNNHHKHNILSNLSNTQIANLLGTIRHVVERTLKQLKEQDIIETTRKNIKIKNLDKLLQKTTRLLK